MRVLYKVDDFICFNETELTWYIFSLFKIHTENKMIKINICEINDYHIFTKHLHNNNNVYHTPYNTYI